MVHRNTLWFFNYFRFIPESTRYLLVQGRVDQCEKILRDVARVNKKQYPDEPLKDPNSGRREEIRLGDFRDLFSSRRFVYRTLIIWFIWWVRGNKNWPSCHHHHLRRKLSHHHPTVTLFLFLILIIVIFIVSSIITTIVQHRHYYHHNYHPHSHLNHDDLIIAIISHNFTILVTVTRTTITMVSIITS